MISNTKLDNQEECEESCKQDTTCVVWLFKSAPADYCVLFKEGTSCSWDNYEEKNDVVAAVGIRSSYYNKCDEGD